MLKKSYLSHYWYRLVLINERGRQEGKGVRGEGAAAQMLRAV